MRGKCECECECECEVSVRVSVSVDVRACAFAERMWSPRRDVRDAETQVRGLG